MDIITEFCKEQSSAFYYGNNRKRKSILLQIQDDIDYNLGLYKSFKTLGITEEQHKKIDTELAPLFVVPLLFCSAIDIMARVKIKDSCPKQNGKVFKESAKEFFGFNRSEAEAMWKFRNSITHQYTIRGFIISRVGDQKVIDVNSDRTVIAVRPMRSFLANAINNLSDSLRSESKEDKIKTNTFLEKYGFTYYLVY